ncbi:MAG: hypothetical protein AB7E32_06170 [Desulfovibrio sp.]
MDSITGYAIQDLLYPGASSSGNTAGTASASGAAQEGGDEAARLAGQGDTLQISQEARALLATKMSEYGVNDPTQLSSEEREGIRTALEEAEGVTDQDREAIAAADSHFEQMASGDAGAAGGQDGSRESGQAVSDGDGQAQAAGQGGGAAAGSGSSSGSDVEDEITDKENEIDDLKAEIENLQAKAVNDPEASEELKTKRVELSMLEMELAQLEQQSGE